MLAHRNVHTYTVWIFLCLFVSFFLFLFSSLHRVFFFFHLQETAYEILIMMHYQDYVPGLLRSPCVWTCVPFSGLLFCLLMTTVFQTFALFLSTLVCRFLLCPFPPLISCLILLLLLPFSHFSAAQPHMQTQTLASSTAYPSSAQTESSQNSCVLAVSLCFHFVSEIMW